MRFRIVLVTLCMCAYSNLSVTAPAQQSPPLPPAEPSMKDVLLLPSIATPGRTWVRQDHHEGAMVDVGTQEYLPLPGDAVNSGGDAEVQWFEASAAEDGWVSNDALRGGYAYWHFESPVARVMILEASGHSMVYVNGVPRVGDPYETGYVRIPVLVRGGINWLHFRGARGRVKARLVEPPSGGIVLNTADATLGDAATGATAPWHGAVVLINATREPLSGLRAVVEGGGASDQGTPIPTIPPLSIRKIVFAATRAWGEAGERELTLQVVRESAADPEVVASATVRIRVRNPDSGETFRHTFFSGIDGSLQYYAARHATGTDATGIGLVLTLHGAGVEATGQADAYAPKADFHIVAPTNRRPYGFDWEDWGRIDAMEVLDDAARRFPHDSRRVYLTGHSMGGHGAWQIGGLFPDRFAAIAPSAGWPTFWTYTEPGGKAPWDGNSPNTFTGMVGRGTRTSDTLALVDNYLGMGVYILHGDKDDNVPVAQARMMKDLLTKAGHSDLGYHEQPGAGHWWGNECVDWPGIFEMFRRRTIPEVAGVDAVTFVTPDPTVSGRSRWVEIESQQQRLVPSRVEARVDRSARVITATTKNVGAIALDVGVLGLAGGVTVDLDGTRLTDLKPGSAAKGVVRLRREGDKWLAANGSPPRVPGPFKRAFDNNFVLVYATRGTEEENACALAKARFDAETWWYRGNGSCDIIEDDAFDPEAGENRSRNVILYGNAQINSAYGKVVPDDAPASVTRGRITVGDRRMEEGDFLGILFVCRRRGASGDGPLVGVVGATGARGMRALDRTPVFTSGVGLPDVLVIGADMLVRGSKGVRLIGFYGPDGTIGSGEVVNQKGFDMPGDP